MARYLFIVARDDRALLELLTQQFADDPNVEVVSDRRVRSLERPAVERRTRPEVDEEIRTRGYAVVTLP
jgi:hypothetical protein